MNSRDSHPAGTDPQAAGAGSALAAQASAAGRVLVVFEVSDEGRAALAHAHALAEAAGAPLTVLSVVPHEREDVGCARCRYSAVIWNQELSMIAGEELEQAAAQLGRSPSIVYRVARGDFAPAVTQAAAACRAEIVVVADRPQGRLRRGVPRDHVKLRAAAEPWRLVIAPPAQLITDRLTGEPPR